MQRMIASILIALVTGAQPVPGTLEIEASLFGYNLLWPSDRCCTFELHVASGETVLRFTKGSGNQPDGSTINGRLSEPRKRAVAKVIDDSQFFSLSKVVGVSAIDGDVRKLRIRRSGGAWHQVEIGESAFGSAPVSSAERRAASAWRAIRGLVEIPGANVP